MIEKYKEEIHKCSKCGLCQSVCPVYKVTGNDCSVSRGKFIMLNGIIKGDLDLNKNINKYLDMCLKCNACKDFCPSDIDARKIFLTAKAEFFKKARNSKFIKILNSANVFNLFLNLIKITTNTYRFFKLDRLLEYFYPILLKFYLGKKIILTNKFIYKPSRQAEFVSASYQGNTLDRSRNKFGMKRQTLSIVYFKGCVNEYINPRTKIAAEKILAQMDIEILPAKFQCCGVPFLSCGNVEQFIKQAEFNLKQIPDNFDFFLTDCASCQNAFREYKNYIEDEKLLKKIDKILEKSMSVNEFIIKNIKSIEFSEKTSFTFHKPCHLENIDFLEEFLAKSKNVEYIKMKDFDKCCGFSGEFAIKNPEISKQISAQKAKNAIDTKANYILTSCPACILGLNQGLIEGSLEASKLLTFIEFILQAKIEV